MRQVRGESRPFGDRSARGVGSSSSRRFRPERRRRAAKRRRGGLLALLSKPGRHQREMRSGFVALRSDRPSDAGQARSRLRREPDASTLRGVDDPLPCGSSRCSSNESEVFRRHGLRRGLQRAGAEGARHRSSTTRATGRPRAHRPSDSRVNSFSRHQSIRGPPAGGPLRIAPADHTLVCMGPAPHGGGSIFF